MKGPFFVRRIELDGYGDTPVKTEAEALVEAIRWITGKDSLRTRELIIFHERSKGVYFHWKDGEVVFASDGETLA